MRHLANKFLFIAFCVLGQESSAQEIKIGFSEDLGGVEYLIYHDTLPEPILRNAFKENFSEKAIVKTMYNTFNTPVESADSARVCIQQIVDGSRDESFSTIQFEVFIEKGPLLSFSSLLTLEGFNKQSNSLTSGYPHTYPVLIDVQQMKLLENLETFMKENKIGALRKKIHANFTAVQKEVYAEGFVDDCRISKTSPDQWKETDPVISNTRSMLESEDEVWYFYLARDGMHFSQNHLELELLICSGPAPEYLLPWKTLLKWIRPEYAEFFEQTYLNCR